MTRADSVTFRLSDHIKKVLQELARQENRTLSNYIEQSLALHINSLPTETRRLASQALVERGEDWASLYLKGFAHFGEALDPARAVPEEVPTPSRKSKKKKVETTMVRRSS